MSVTKGFSATVLAGVLLAALASCEGTYKTGWVEPSRFHAEMLVAGDFRVADGGPVPYHLKRMVELRYASSPVLIELLNNTSPTPIDCIGEAMFSRTYMQIGPGEPLRKATIADLANWALREIYGVSKGVGFRGDLGQAQRQEAIERWVDLITACELNARVRRDALPPSKDGAPGELFPSVPETVK